MKINSRNIHSIKENCLEDIVGGLIAGGGNFEITIKTPGTKIGIELPQNAVFQLIKNGLVEKTNSGLVMDLTHSPVVAY